MKKYLSIIPILMLLACQSVHSPITSDLGEEFKIRFGEQITFPGEGFSIQFNDVLEESRCPKGVECVWAGNAKIALQFNKQEIKLNTHTDHKTQDTISGYTIQLISLKPHPEYNHKIQEKEYVAKLLITKN